MRPFIIKFVSPEKSPQYTSFILTNSLKLVRLFAELIFPKGFILK